MDGPIGLDYTACKIVIESLGETFDDIMLRRLKLLEQKVLNERSKDNDKGS